MANAIQKTFAGNVRYYRKKLKLTQAQLAKIINCTASFIGYIETAKTSVSLDTIEALSIALQVRPSALFTPCDENGNSTLGEAAPKYSTDIVSIISDLTRVIDKHKEELSPLFEKSRIDDHDDVC